ncbi:hypothetical protein WG66_011041 [Moniliophthora roreri]|nr:hypothetical protein WG66_011041 [Moniliophthora roreri]
MTVSVSVSLWDSSQDWYDCSGHQWILQNMEKTHCVQTLGVARLPDTRSTDGIECWPLRGITNCSVPSYILPSSLTIVLASLTSGDGMRWSRC